MSPSTWRHNASIFEPTGKIAAQITPPESILVHELDLSYAILPWSSKLRNGEALRKAYGEKLGFRYYEDEDCGIFWSNDPKVTVGEMVRSMGCWNSRRKWHVSGSSIGKRGYRASEPEYPRAASRHARVGILGAGRTCSASPEPGRWKGEHEKRDEEKGERSGPGAPNGGCSFSVILAIFLGARIPLGTKSSSHTIESH